MNNAVVALSALAVCASAANAADEPPLHWTINARILEVNGSPPEGPLENIAPGWTVEINATLTGTTPEPDPMVPFGEHRRRLLFGDSYSVEFDDGEEGDLDDYLLVGAGNEIDGAYLPRNFEGEDSADYTLGDLPLQRSRGGGEEETFDLVFGFFGEDGLLESDDAFIAQPDLSQTLGTGFFVFFENGAFARGELVAWESAIVPAPGAAALFGLGALAALRRRR